jgi:hypothetical protein
MTPRCMRVLRSTLVNDEPVGPEEERATAFGCRRGHEPVEQSYTRTRAACEAMSGLAHACTASPPA